MCGPLPGVVALHAVPAGGDASMQHSRVATSLLQRACSLMPSGTLRLGGRPLYIHAAARAREYHGPDSTTPCRYRGFFLSFRSRLMRRRRGGRRRRGRLLPQSGPPPALSRSAGAASDAERNLQALCPGCHAAKTQRVEPERRVEARSARPRP